MSGKRLEVRLIGTEQDLQEAAKIMANSFMKLNKLWHKVQPDYEDAYQAFYYKLELSMKQGLARNLCLDGKIIGTSASFPLEYYLDLPKRPSKSKIFNLLNHYSTVLEKMIPRSRDEKAIFGALVAMAPEHGLKGYSLELWLEGFKIMQRLGFNTFYSWTTSPVSRFLCKKLGVEEIGEVTMTEEEVKGGWMVLLRLDLTKRLPELHELKKMLMNPGL